MAREPFTSVTVAKILRARGIRGEVAAEILTDFPERLTLLRKVWLVGGSAGPRQIGVQRCWLSTSRGGQAIFHLEGVDSIEAAETLRGLEIQVPIEQRAKLEAGYYFVDDLIGCQVWEAGSTVAMGVVRDVEFPGGVPLLAVTMSDEADEEAILVPLAAEICTRVDVKAKRIDVVLPEGLHDLNLR